MGHSPPPARLHVTSRTEGVAVNDPLRNSLEAARPKASTPQLTSSYEATSGLCSQKLGLIYESGLMVVHHWILVCACVHLLGLSIGPSTQPPTEPQSLIRDVTCQITRSQNDECRTMGERNVRFLQAVMHRTPTSIDCSSNLAKQLNFI